RALVTVGRALPEGPRERQSDAQRRTRYEETLATPYQVPAGALLEFGGAAPERSTVEAAFQTMERLRARSLLESLIAPAAQPGGTRKPLSEPPPPTLTEVQAALTASQALVSYPIRRRG